MSAAFISSTQAAGLVIQESYRRRHIRYPLRVPVEFRRAGSHGSPEVVKGVTRDISEGGAFVITRELPPLGATVELAAHLSVLHSRPVLTVEMVGEVVRLETQAGQEERWGYALSANRTVFRGPGKSRKMRDAKTRTEKSGRTTN